jgi:hypothetical protein
VEGGGGGFLPDEISMLSIFPVCVIAPAMHLPIHVDRAAVVRPGSNLRKHSSRWTALIPRIVAPAH